MTRGVEKRESSIRMVFAFQGRTERRTLMVEGKPMAPTPANLKYAARLIVEIRDRIKADAFHMAEYFPVAGTTARGGTVGDQLDHWLGVQTIETSTRKGYLSSIKFWKTALIGKPARPFGEMPMSTVRHSDILAAIKTKPKMHGKTHNNHLSVLRGAMQLAVLDKVLRENPVGEVENAPWQREDPDPFDRDEVDQIVAYAREHYDPSIANLIEFRFFTGVRTSEMVGLQWGSIDFPKRQMLVREAVVDHERKNTKTNVVRLVQLNSRAFAALERQRELAGRPETARRGNVIALVGKTAPAPAPEAEIETVWLDPRYGTPWLDERAFRRSFWTPALKALGVRYRPPNNARHSYATMLLMAGARPGYAAKQMGHSIEIFLKTYSKWIDGDANDIEHQKLEQFISAPVGAKKAS